MALIRATNVTKTYVTRRSRATSLKEMVVSNWFDQGEEVVQDALKDVSFEIGAGHNLAVVGGNGSGKSTLLRLLAGISQPTSGTLEVNGRVAAMLELGAGFHPELTGMENIFLQGSIAGLSRAEILRRLDAVLEFAELGAFIHTPMRKYSSGMVVRLGFAIAIQSGAEVLLLDEVLAVGDGYFQTKCLREIDRLRNQGRTIFFVSHNLEQVESIADSVLWLERGAVRMSGSAREVLDAFARSNNEAIAKACEGINPERDGEIDTRQLSVLMRYRSSGRKARLHNVRVLDADGRDSETLETGRPWSLEVDLEVFEPLPTPFTFNASVGSGCGLHAIQIEETAPFVGMEARPGRYTVRLEAPPLRLVPARYDMTISLTHFGDPSRLYDVHVRLYQLTVRAPGEPLRHFEEALLRAPGTFVAE